MNLINRLTANDFAELCGVLCPYCRISLPVRDNTDAVDNREVKAFVHTIPDTDHAFICRASEVRGARRLTAYRMPPE